jgi:hypothetical protein
LADSVINEHRSKAEALAERMASARRKPNALSACELCRSLMGYGLCATHAAEVTAQRVPYPQWLQGSIGALRTGNRRARWRRAAATYRQQHPGTRRESWQAYNASPLATMARERYYGSVRGHFTRLEQYLRNLRTRTAAKRMQCAALAAELAEIDARIAAAAATA